MREAHTLRADGHSVTVIGVPDPDNFKPIEYLKDGVRVFRVMWQASAYRKLLWSSVFRALPVAVLVAAIIYGVFRFIGWLLKDGGPLTRLWFGLVAVGSRAANLSLLGAIYVALLVGLGIAVGYLVVRMLRSYVSVLAASIEMRAKEEDTIRRYAATVLGEGVLGSEFPRIRSRIPSWIPDFVLEMILEPLDWLGAKTGKLSLYRYRSEEIAALAIRIKPDVIHCHDCMALPTGWLVKRALKIPLVYDAHEIYEAAVARTFGITDYYARIHAKYLPRVDAFITINESAALYYRYAYPSAPPAVVIRNATNLAPAAAYDGRLHRAAGLPTREKILLYQGGFTADRGLPVLVRSAPLLPEGWTLVMMGWGPLAGELKQIASLAGARTRPDSMSDKVRFVPGVPASELLLWTQGATVGIIPYENKMLNHWISTPNKLWEYPNAGVPLIVQPFPEMRRVVETYRCGWILPEELSPGAIADLIASLTDDMIAAARAGCRHFVEEDSWSSTYEGRLLDLYDKLSRQATSSASVAKDTLTPARAAV